LDISRKGLASRCNNNSYGEDETIHLDYLYQIVNSKKSQAMNLIDLYMHEGNLNVDKLYQSESF
jgi:gamma-glutamylcysteine synthetase